jgi:hypothetical protein
MLERVMTSVALDNDRERQKAGAMALQAQQATPQVDLQAAIVAAAQQLQGNSNQNNRNKWRDPCDKCGVPHPGGGDDCHAYLLSQGKDVPGWEKKTPEMQERLRNRAEAITRLGPFSQRGGGNNNRRQPQRGGGGGEVAKALATILAMANLQPTVQSVIHIPMALASATTKPSPLDATRLIMDSGNLTGSHLISDRRLFSKFSTEVPSVPVMVANRDIEWTNGGGTCDMLAVTSDNKVLGRLVLHDCKFIDPARFGVNLVSIQQAWRDGIPIRFEDHKSPIRWQHHSHLPRGLLPLGDSYAEWGVPGHYHPRQAWPDSHRYQGAYRQAAGGNETVVGSMIPLRRPCASFTITSMVFRKFSSTLTFTIRSPSPC